MQRKNTTLKPFVLAFLATATLGANGLPAFAESAETIVSATEQTEKNNEKSSTVSAPTTVHAISVTATRTERDTFDVPASIAVVGEEELKHNTQATVAEQLRDIPGVQISDGGIGGGAKRVTIRGESGSRVLVLIDGIKISEQKSMDGSMIMIDPANIERIEVIKGPASVLYGSEAIGGAVNIITKKGGNKPLQGSFITTYNSSNNSFTPYLSLYGAHKGFSYRISGDYVNAANKHGANGMLPNTAYRESNWSAYLDYSWSKGKIGGGYDHYESSNHIPGVTTTETSSNTINAGTGQLNVSGPATVGIAMTLPKWQRDRYYAFLEINDVSTALKKIKVTPFIQSTVKDFINDISLDYQASAPSPMPPAGGLFLYNQQMRQHIKTRNSQISYGINAQTDWALGDNHYVIAGMDYLYDDLDAYTDTTLNMTLRMKPNTSNPAIPWVTVPVKQNTHYTYKGYQQTLAAYVQDEWLITPNWTATLGLRATWIQSKLSHVSDPALAAKSTSASHLVASAGLVYSGFEDWRLRGTYSQGYRYPSLNQLYIGTSHGNSGYNYPNPNLKPETSHNFELGARYSANGFTGDFSVFYSLADNYIDALALSDSFDRQYKNMNSAKTAGAELVLSYTHEPWHLTPYISAAYLHREYSLGGNNGKTSLTGDPRLTGRVGLKYEHSFTPEFTFYADAFGRFASGAKEKLENGTISKHPGWGTANLAVGGRFGKEQRVFVDLALNNLLNKRFTLAKSSVEEAGFHTVLRVGVEF